MSFFLKHPALDEHNPLHQRFDTVIEMLGDTLEDWEFATAFAERLIDLDFLTAPASTVHHLAHTGGLCEHSLNVVEALMDILEETDDWHMSCVPIIIGLTHDLCKVDCYKQQPDGSFTWGGHTLGDTFDDYEHGSLSRRRAKRILDETWTNRDMVLSGSEYAELLDAIEFHMGLYEPKMLRVTDAEDTDQVAVAIQMRYRFLDASNKSQLVTCTHIADMLATNVMER